MKYVYLLQSIDFSDETYVGLTDDLRARFTAHNAGRSPHTAKYKLWRLVTYIAFSNEQKAVEFERYLKSASAGRLQTSGYGRHAPWSALAPCSAVQHGAKRESDAAKRLTGGDFDLGIAARHRLIERGNNSVHVSTQDRPLGVSKNNDRYSPTGQVLLIPDVLVSCYEYFEAFSLSCIK
jgi:predicted GIY-YIG superfamily endonuclease